MSDKKKMPSLNVEKETLEESPKIVQPANDSLKKMPSSKGIILVKALRKGFYKNSRKNQGDKFKVASMKDLGSWMECCDPKHQEEHLKVLAAKRKHLKEAGR